MKKSPLSLIPNNQVISRSFHTLITRSRRTALMDICEPVLKCKGSLPTHYDTLLTQKDNRATHLQHVHYHYILHFWRVFHAQYFLLHRHTWAGSPELILLVSAFDVSVSVCEKTFSAETWMILVDKSRPLAEDSPCFWIWHRRTCRRTRAARAWRWWWWTGRGLPAPRSCLKRKRNIKRWRSRLSYICWGWQTEGWVLIFSQRTKTTIYCYDHPTSTFFNLIHSITNCSHKFPIRISLTLKTTWRQYLL